MCALQWARFDRPVPPLTDEYWDEFPLRDDSERTPLFVLSTLVSFFGVDELINAEFVPDYLVYQPWGSSISERVKNFRVYLTRSNPMANLMWQLFKSYKGYLELLKYDLVSDPIPPYAMQLAAVMAPSGLADTEAENERHGNSEGEVLADNGMGNEVENVVPRARDQSYEEQRLRRQHREAMVLNDGTRPLRRGDIIEREDES